MAHAELQGKMAYQSTATQKAQSTSAMVKEAGRGEGRVGDPLEDLLAQSPIHENYQSYVCDAEDCTAL